MKTDHRSKFSNLSNWKEEAWKYQGFNGIRTSDLCNTGAMLYQSFFELLKFENLLWWSVRPSTPAVQLYELFHICFTSLHFSWEVWTQWVDLAPNVWLHGSVGRASHRYRGGHGLESRWSLDFFRFLLSNCLNRKIYWDDQSSLWSTPAVQVYTVWIVSYMLHITCCYL